MTKAIKLLEQLTKAQARAAKLEAQFTEVRLNELQKVTVTKSGETITLAFGDRVIKAKKPSRYNDRYNLTENGKILAKEVFGSIHDIRFAIAVGQI
jgi:hypothetical protein